MADVHRHVVEASRAEEERKAAEAKAQAEREARIEAAAAAQAEAKAKRAALGGNSDLLAKRSATSNGTPSRTPARLVTDEATRRRLGGVAAAAVAAEKAKDRSTIDLREKPLGGDAEPAAADPVDPEVEDRKRLSRLWWAAFLGPAAIVVVVGVATSWQDRTGGVAAFTLGVWALTLMLALPPVVSADHRSSWWLVPPVVMSFASALLAFGLLFGFAALTDRDDSPIGSTDTTRRQEVTPTTAAAVAGVSTSAPTEPALAADPATAPTTAASTPPTDPWPDFGPNPGPPPDVSASTPPTDPWPDFGPNPGPPPDLAGVTTGSPSAAAPAAG